MQWWLLAQCFDWHVVLLADWLCIDWQAGAGGYEWQVSGQQLLSALPSRLGHPSRGPQPLHLQQPQGKLYMTWNQHLMCSPCLSSLSFWGAGTVLITIRQSPGRLGDSPPLSLYFVLFSSSCCCWAALPFSGLSTTHWRSHWPTRTSRSSTACAGDGEIAGPGGCVEGEEWKSRCLRRSTGRKRSRTQGWSCMQWWTLRPKRHF